MKLTASPMVPRPKTATIEPGSTFAVFQTAPRPRESKLYSVKNVTKTCHTDNHNWNMIDTDT